MIEEVGMKNNLRTFAAVGIVLLVTVSAMAQGPAAAHAEPHNQAGGGDPIRQLNLTPEQREQIRGIREQSRDERAKINERLRETNRALEETLNLDNPDEAAVEQRMREVAAAQAAVMRMRILTEVKVRRVLTLEQRALLRTLRQQAQEMRRERRLERPERLEQRRQERRTLRLQNQRNRTNQLLRDRNPQRRPPL